MNSQSLSPREKHFLKKTLSNPKPLTAVKKLSPTKPSHFNFKITSSESLTSSSKLCSSASKPSLKLLSPYSKSDFALASQGKLRAISQKFSMKNGKIGEFLLPLAGTKVASIFTGVLGKYEISEVVDYDEVHYLGLKAKKNQPKVKLKNFGFDDKETDYILVVGDHIGYRYEVLNVLGSGSFAQVCKCWDHKNKVEVAVKVLKSHRRFLEQGQIELKVLSFLKKHANVSPSVFVKMLACFNFRSHLCIVFELLSFTLYDLLKANHFKGFSSTLVRRFTSQILHGLSFLNSNQIIHCDLKPENLILINPQESSLKIIDFGSSCFESEKIYYYIQSRIYRAPEVILGVPYTAAIDMWSLGCIIAEISTGVPLFQGENEFEQLLAIMEVLGYPPDEMIGKAGKRNKFFNKDFSLKTTNAKMKIPGVKRLEEKVMSGDLIYLDFLKSMGYLGCLEWTPERRMTPEEALSHPWIKEICKSTQKSGKMPSSPRLKIT